MKKTFLKVASAVLSIVMILSVLPLSVFADEISDALAVAEDADPIVVIAGSDFQSPEGHAQSAANVNAILTSIRQKYASAYGFLFAGDYDYNYTDSKAGKDTLKATVQNNGFGIQDYVFVQGNHDSTNLIKDGTLSASGDNDTDHYGVFVINEQDYMRTNSDEQKVTATAAALNEYLSEKASAGYKKPIFVVSHLPLHYSMRTYTEGDARYADKLVKVLNNYANGGLNIIYLYGHNHSNGWDDYLGGSSVFLRPGNVLLVADGTKTGFDRYTLGFTYMNAGFTGYYSDMGSGADTALTMTAFAIYSDRVEINRFDKNGGHHLKAKGYYGAKDMINVEKTMYDPSGRIYEHTEIIHLDKSNSIGAPEYTPETEDHGWIQVDATESPIWRSASALTNGNRYLILNNYTAGTRNALAVSSGGALSSSSVLVRTNNHDGNYVEQFSDSMVWTYSNNKLSTVVNGTTYYLQGSNKNNANVTLTTDSSDSYTTWKIDNSYGLYVQSQFGFTKYYMSNGFKITNKKNKNNRVYLFGDETISTPSLYASFLGSSGVTLPAGVYATYADLSHIIHESFTIFTADDTNGKNKKIVHDYTIETIGNPVDPKTPGRYTLSIQYMGVEITKYVVNIKDRAIASLSCNPMHGSATVGSTTTGSVLTVEYSDGAVAHQYVTVDMLQGDFNLRVPGVYNNLTISYGGKTINGYSLNVYVNDYPEFPHEGSIRVNKGVTGIDFNNSGVARVELSTTGVPVKRGADVIVMLDTSSSMNNEVGGSTRIDVLNDSLADLISDLQRDGEDGNPMDIRISIADFNNYFTDKNSPYYLNYGDVLSGADHRDGSSNPDVDVYTGDHSLTAGSMIDVHDLIVRDGRLYDSNNKSLTMSTSSGTNYDYAFDAVYQIASSVKAQNEKNNEDRDLFVIFMSDGGPFQYNYFSSDSESTNWNAWLTGNDAGIKYATGANQNYFNTDGKHWMAEAIKGDPNQRYTVIRKNEKGLENYLNSTGTQNIYTLPGLGATMFSIGFCLVSDKKVELSTIRTVLQNISSDKELMYYECNDAEDLESAFHMIGQEINYAATNAYFVDIVGKSFDLQLSKVEYDILVGEQLEKRTVFPEIKFTLYGLYTHADVEAGIISHDQIGTRNGFSTLVETVSFNEDGTAAYSNGNTEENIMRNGVIYARHFWYNTNDYSVMIDTNMDGVDDFLLSNETFYWKIGTINQHDMVLSYNVYLTGSAEGQIPEGSYATNESAILYYTNWLGNQAYRETVSPQISWQASSVRYAFYLVDENGHPMVNQEMGMTGSFANRLNLTTPTFYSMLTSTTTLKAADLATEILTEGYELYDPNATFTVHVSEGKGAHAWTIGKGDVASSSTYVTGHDGYQFTNTLEESNSNYDYSHTVVWFAVVYKVKPMPDVIVIDYAQPVNIQVLLNDMFYNRGGVVAVGPLTTTANQMGDAKLSSSFIVNGTFATSYEGKYGTATISPEGIQYVLKKDVAMNMSEPEIFSYAVLYETRYYYGVVTVIPATNMYFEENFLEYVDSSAAADSFGVWTDLGEADSNMLQAVDRPGFNNLASLDANNVYGYDPHNVAYTTLSNGGAKVVTVNYDVGGAATAPYTTFTFTGTGFDIISLTNNTGATIFVSVTDKDGKAVASKSVNCYYGYTYTTEDGWKLDVTSNATVWQVPVIKIDGLDKGTYTVKVSVIYLESTEDLYPDGISTFVLDSIRIYDSAKGNAQADAAHKADKEYAPFYISMKDLVLGTEDVRDQENIPGVVFIDGKVATDSFDDYENPGPNNELYLAKGQGIAFKLTATAIPTSAQIGVKMAIGENGVIKHGIHDFIYVHGASNMYYPMNDITWNAVTDADGKIMYYETTVITLSHSERVYYHDPSTVISFTGFKFTFEENDGMVEPKVDNETVEVGIAVMSTLYASQDPEQDEDTDTETETLPEQTEPETEVNSEPETEPVTNPSSNGTVQETEPSDDDSTEDKNSKGCRSAISFSSLTVFAMLIMLAALALAGRKRA